MDRTLITVEIEAWPQNLRIVNGRLFIDWQGHSLHVHAAGTPRFQELLSHAKIIENNGVFMRGK